MVAFVYFMNILNLIIGFSEVESFPFFDTTPKTGFTIIVPFRNEAINLPKLLNSIDLLDYPLDLFEVILVDDESSENFQLPTSNFQIRLIKNIRISNSPKKDAINTAITKAKFDWVITTDADCEVQSKWLMVIDNYIKKYQPKMIASGVFYKTNTTFLEYFQQLDVMSLQGTTIGSFGNGNAFMCNGANFCYQTAFFYALNGFEGNQNITSGDDVFLLQKGIKKEPESVRFLKSEMAIVQTQPESSWGGLFFQRVRWASKTKNYSTLYSKQLALSVFLMNASVLFIILGLPFYCLSSYVFFLFLGLKFLIDYILLFKTSKFFKTRLRYILLGSLLYPFFNVSVVLYSFFGKYEWKGRKF
jgi:glycosyltransferase involved in cell wall biosynthesis